MSDYIVKDTELTSVANAIRTKGGTNSQLVFPGGFVSAIGNISGGGGSSDFSTAEVTIAPFDGGYTEYKYPLPGVDDVDNTIMILHPMARDDSKTITVPLYKGKLTINTGENIGISGDFVYNSDFGELTITGDCTIKGYAMQ